MKSDRLTTEEVKDIYERSWRTVWRLCFSFMKNQADTEDMVQETFLRLISSSPALSGPDHEKAWLIVTASNLCKDRLKNRLAHMESLDDESEDGPQVPYEDPGISAENYSLTQAILNLPDRYKTVVYLYYYEGYTTREIAGMLRKPHASVRTFLARARAILKKELGDEFYGK